MSICAHLKGASLPFSDSIPSTKAFKNRVAVQLPAGRPPVYPKTRLRSHMVRKERHSRSADQHSTSRFAGRILHRWACARICRVPPRQLHGVLARDCPRSMRRKSKVICAILPTEGETNREHACIYFSQSDIHGSVMMVSADKFGRSELNTYPVSVATSSSVCGL